MYQVLARKYRPRNFAELVGQTHVSRALSSALERGRLHHAYLFTGTRGVGKTTIARILSKCLNCETGITATPCGVCGTCRAIDEGRFIDLIEIDAASRTKVEDTRELLDNVPYAPSQGRYKVYLIDEVHMLSTHSFNALLKTLEEPPEHVKFLLATTDPQKLPVTVLSRCLQFTLRPLPRQEIHDHLSQVLGKEHISFDDAALWLLAESAQGSLRDAMSLTDQAIAYGQGSVSGADVQTMLGLLDRSQVAHLLLAIHQGQSDQVAKILFDLTQQAVDVSAILDQLVTLLHQVALAQLLPQQADIGTPLEAEILRKLANSMDRQDVQLYYQIALQGRADLKLAVTAQQGFEMCILRLLAFRPLALNEISPSQSVHSDPITQFVAPAVASAPADNLQVQTDSLQVQTDSLQVKKNLESLADLPVTDVTSSVDVEKPIEIELSFDRIPPIEVTTVAHDLTTESVMPAEDSAAEPVLDQVSESVDVESPIHADHAQYPQNDTLFAQEDTDAKFPAGLSEAALSESIAISEPQQQIAVQIDEVVEESAEPVVPLVFSAPINNHSSAPVQAVRTDTAVYAEHGVKNPFEILAHPVAELVGAWTPEKWEFWLRERAKAGVLSGGMLSLGQHGLMRGEIGGTAEFLIAAEHRVLTSQMRDGLLAALKADWPQSHFEVVLEKVTEMTPVQRKELRLKHAHKKAHELLVSDPAIAPLISLFEGEVIDLTMKESPI